MRRLVGAALTTTLLVLLVACGSGSPAPAIPTAPASPTPYALAKNAPAYTGPVEQVTGLSITAADTSVTSSEALPAVPASKLPAWDGHSVLLYDLQTGKVTNLGDGAIGFGVPFSADGTHLTWQVGPDAGSARVANSQIWVLDLQTGKRTSYGQAAAASFGPDGTLRLAALDGTRLAQHDISLATGKTVTEGKAVDSTRMHYPQGFVVERGAASKKAPLLFMQTLIPDGGGAALQFDASLVVPIDGQRAVLAILRNTGGTANVYRIDVGSTTATFVATVHALPPIVALDNGTLALDDRASCDDPNGRILLYDPASQSLRALTTPLAPSDAGVTGLGIDGNLGAARAVLEPSTMQYTQVLPAPGFFSRDGRYAVVGASVAMATDGCHTTGAAAANVGG